MDPLKPDDPNFVRKIIEEVFAETGKSAVVADTVRVEMIEGFRATVSKATVGLRELWYIAVTGRGASALILGPGRSDPGSTLIESLVGRYRANLFSANARWN